MTGATARARRRDYFVFGLAVRSELELPELLPVGQVPAPDVMLRYGCVDSDIFQPGLHEIGTALLLVVPNVGRFRIEGGFEVVVEPVAGVPAQNVRLYLLGSAFGALLHQRGLLPLHANAVEIGGKAVAFMGKSGAGKSTLACWFHDRGFRVLSDDVCVVEFDSDERPQVRPGLGRLRLWREFLDATGRDVADHPRSFIDDNAPDKYDVALAEPLPPETRLPLGAIYLLERGDESRVEPIEGVAAVEAAFANTYRGAFVERTRTSRDHWSASLKLVSGSPMFRVERRWGLEHLAVESTRLLKHAEETLGSG